MRTISILLTVLALAACGGKKTEPTTPPTGEGSGGETAGEPKKLYDRLGGTEGITTVVDMFVTNVGANAKINGRFKGADLKALKEKLVLQICEATGGPCKYTGVHKDMKTAHTGMKITAEEFDSMVGDLVKALNDAKVGQGEQDELLGALGGMKGDIIDL